MSQSRNSVKGLGNSAGKDKSIVGYRYHPRKGFMKCGVRKRVYRQAWHFPAPFSVAENYPISVDHEWGVFSLMAKKVCSALRSWRVGRGA